MYFSKINCTVYKKNSTHFGMHFMHAHVVIMPVPCRANRDNGNTHFEEVTWNTERDVVNKTFTVHLVKKK